MTYFDMSNDVVTFLSEHYLEQCALLGHSMGGKVAMATALQHPEIVEKLIVVDVSPTRAPGTSQLLDYITVLQELDLSLIKSKSEADRAISKVIAVSQCTCSVHLCAVIKYATSFRTTVLDSFYLLIWSNLPNLVPMSGELIFLVLPAIYSR